VPFDATVSIRVERAGYLPKERVLDGAKSIEDILLDRDTGRVVVPAVKTTAPKALPPPPVKVTPVPPPPPPPSATSPRPASTGRPSTCAPEDWDMFARVCRK